MKKPNDDLPLPNQLILLLLLFLTTASAGVGARKEDAEFIIECPTDCSCTSPSKLQFLTVSCISLNLTSIPDGISATTKKLDLSGNNLTWIGQTSLAHLTKLQELNLKSNLIKDMEPSAFANLSELRELTLSRNQLKHFPADVLQFNSRIELLRVDHNHITRLEKVTFKTRPKLYALHLGNNLIKEIDDDAFNGLASIHILELNDNRLTEVPAALKRLPNLGELSLANNRILRIDVPFHQLIPKIVLLEIRGNPTQWIHPEGFTLLKYLKKLILSDVKNLTEFPHLNGTSALEILRIDRCSLQSVPENLCLFAPKLKSLDLRSNRITIMPDLSACTELKILDLSINLIEDLGSGTFEVLSSLHDLHISGNRLKQIADVAFHGLNNLRTLDMSYNMIADIHPDAFLPVEKLEDLNLGNNVFPELPTQGLEGVLHLKTFNNPNLREFPGPESFPRVRTLVLSYAYHCCQFNSLRVSTGHPNSGLGSAFQEDVIYPTDRDFDSALSTLNLSELWPGLANFSNHGALAEDFLRSFSGDIFTTEPPPFDYTDIASPRVNQHFSQEIQCIPTPGPFLPCNDLFDWWTLRCGVWIVFLLALMGNGTVVFVLIFARTKMDVPRFLVCNLAIADFCMGVYLGFLAVIDAATLGEFRKFAIPWQLSNACQTAGFLGVLSSELSVYTLAVITMERHYAITHAMHLNKRLSLRHASYIMVLGWSFSLLMATLPLFGISDYRKFAVCLPFETGDGWSMSYVVFLMFANGVAFTILMGCYLKMYCSIRGSQAWNSNDTRIAKRMALLVFTDLLCWFPIAFFSLTAVFGLQLVSLEEAKVFTVFILPFNSCCNPFLYAILTKQFKKDCVLICKAIEESRVTRGIGRCRNSSNFSNRQTAPNTGSLVEKSSKDGQPCICHNGLHPGKDMNGNAKYRFMPAPERWSSRYGPLGRFISRYVLCQNNSKEANRQARDDYRMRNVRRYLYNTANVNMSGPTDPEKHQRHPSVSSDNFSSSRSDSWRAQGRCGIPLRLLEPRRRNSWAVTRKPSQDSNLSNSRNDSSATSNSTNTWRLSRSSVSSDATNHSGGGKSSLKKAVLPGTCAITSTTTAIISNVTHTPSTVVANSVQTSSPSHQHRSNEPRRPKTLQFLDEGILPALHQQKRNSITRSDPIAHSSSSTMGNKSGVKSQKDPAQSTAEVITDLIDDDEVSAKIATNRPRLVRQSAFFSDELVIEPEVCPVHGSLIPGTYDDENEDDDGRCPNISDLEEEDEDEEELAEPTSPILRKYSGSSPNSIITGSGGNPYSIALVIVPRRLSTISSRDTTSIQSRDDQPGGSTGTGTNSIMAPGVSPARRKMSEQPGLLRVVPGSVVNSAKWHSMSSVELKAKENEDTIAENSELLDDRERRVSFQLRQARESPFQAATTTNTNSNGHEALS